MPSNHASSMASLSSAAHACTIRSQCRTLSVRTETSCWSGQENLGLIQRMELHTGAAALPVEALQEVPGDVVAAYLPVDGIQLGEALLRGGGPCPRPSA